MEGFLLVLGPAALAASASRMVSAKSESPLRWAVLFFACLTLLGNYYCYDNPAALKPQLQQSTGLTESQFALTYSVYSFPNMVLPFFGGYLCDRIGPQRVILGCALFRMWLHELPDRRRTQRLAELGFLHLCTVGVLDPRCRGLDPLPERRAPSQRSLLREQL